MAQKGRALLFAPLLARSNADHHLRLSSIAPVRLRSVRVAPSEVEPSKQAQVAPARLVIGSKWRRNARTCSLAGAPNCARPDFGREIIFNWRARVERLPSERADCSRPTGSFKFTTRRAVRLKIGPTFAPVANFCSFSLFKHFFRLFRRPPVHCPVAAAHFLAEARNLKHCAHKQKGFASLGSARFARTKLSPPPPPCHC